MPAGGPFRRASAEDPPARGDLGLMGDGLTIVAHSTGFGCAALAVIRVSGPASRRLIEALAGALPPPRQLALRRLRDPAGADTLDRALVAWFPCPVSFTGEDMAELHVHGGLAVVEAVLAAARRVEGVRLAGPGEFTRRAVLNGKLDLTQAEAIGDLIEAETQAQRRQAQRQLDGALGRTVAGWREDLVTAMALVEADLDFSDEGDVGEDLVQAALERAGAVREAIGTVLEAGRGGERLRDGFTIVIAGPPNAGKSTLLNHLARRDVAIVSPFAGTTRDALEVHCELGGFPVLLIDTAGLRATTDPVESEGVGRARRRIEGADLVLWLSPMGPEASLAAEQPPPGSVVIRTKADLAEPGRAQLDELAVSALTGFGIEALLGRVQEHVVTSAAGGSALITRLRHREAFERTHKALDAAARPFEKAPELVAEDLRAALNELGRVTGHVGAEEILDRIFATFCIGK